MLCWNLSASFAMVYLYLNVFLQAVCTNKHYNYLSFIFINGYIAHFPEGWLELFLNAAEKRNFSRWTENINDKSITHRATKNTFDRIASLLPDTVAPNVITAAGFACLGEFRIHTLTFSMHII